MDGVVVGGAGDLGLDGAESGEGGLLLGGAEARGGEGGDGELEVGDGAGLEDGSGGVGAAGVTGEEGVGGGIGGGGETETGGCDVIGMSGACDVGEGLGRRVGSDGGGDVAGLDEDAESGWEMGEELGDLQPDGLGGDGDELVGVSSVADLEKAGGGVDVGIGGIPLEAGEAIEEEVGELLGEEDDLAPWDVAVEEGDEEVHRLLDLRPHHRLLLLLTRHLDLLSQLPNSHHCSTHSTQERERECESLPRREISTGLPSNPSLLPFFRALECCEMDMRG